MLGAMPRAALVDQSVEGVRDHALLLTLARSSLRVSEVRNGCRVTAQKFFLNDC
jgi:hypothetical protein